MIVLYFTNIKKRLIMISSVLFIWLVFFFAGSYLLDHVLLFSICIDPYIEFSYPYALSVDKILINHKYPDSKAITAFSPIKTRAEQFTNYKSIEGDFSFDYPSAFQLEELDFQGSEILYHIAFRNRESDSHGFVQVWMLDEDLESFLEKSIASSHNTYKYFNIKKAEAGGKEGILWDYSIASGNGYIKGSEFFIKSGNNMYRLSYFVPEEKWDKRQKHIFENMIKSLKIQ